MEFFSSRSVRTWKRSSAPRRYYTIKDIEAGYILDHDPDEVNHQVGGQICIAALFGVSSYAEATKTSEYFDEPLGILNGRYIEIIQDGHTEASRK